jgi:hypothetical protein
MHIQVWIIVTKKLFQTRREREKKKREREGPVELATKVSGKVINGLTLQDGIILGQFQDLMAILNACCSLNESLSFRGNESDQSGK